MQIDTRLTSSVCLTNTLETGFDPVPSKLRGIQWGVVLRFIVCSSVRFAERVIQGRYVCLDSLR